MGFTDKSGKGFSAVADKEPISVSAWNYSMDDLAGARHPFEIPERDFITVNIDYKQMGVGGDTSWGAKTHTQYTMPAGSYSYSFVLKTVK